MRIMEASPVRTGVATLIASVALANELAKADHEPAPERRAHVLRCLEIGASLPTSVPSPHGFRLDVVGPRRLKATIRPEDMSEAAPECEDVDMDRDTDVKVFVNGRKRGVARNVLNPNNDNGERIRRTLRLRRALRIGDRVTGKFLTTAKAEGQEVDDTDTVRFRVTSEE